jgi:hypothetical protein
MIRQANHPMHPIFLTAPARVSEKGGTAATKVAPESDSIVPAPVSGQPA